MQRAMPRHLTSPILSTSSGQIGNLKLE
uniref:Uncharacterized protein n=1 Tax=Anguilla anguilla TaxID=7936 RepID=A0A0E9TWB9_ANGAN